MHLLVYLSLQTLKNQEVEKAHARNAAVNKVFIHNQLKRSWGQQSPGRMKKLQEQHKINKMKIQKRDMLRRSEALACDLCTVDLEVILV